MKEVDIVSKRVDYFISEVCYYTDDDFRYIDSVIVHENNDDILGNKDKMKRDEVIDKIESGRSFMTIYRNNGKWRKGEDVHIIKVKGKKFIRTDNNEKESDNLGDLPTFC